MLQNIYIIIQLKHFKNCYRKSFAGKKNKEMVCKQLGEIRHICLTFLTCFMGINIAKLFLKCRKL